MASRLPTAGAVRVMNEKGEQRMEKVRVQRYIPGQRPAYAKDADSSDSEEELVKPDFTKTTTKQETVARTEAEKTDRRLQRLQQVEPAGDRRRRREAEVVEDDDSGDEEVPAPRRRAPVAAVVEAESSDDEDEIDRRRARLREMAKNRVIEPVEEVLPVIQDEAPADKEEESDEWESYSESSEDDTPILKPTFVSKKDRITQKEQEIREAKERKRLERLRLEAEERRQETKALVEDKLKQEKMQELEADHLVVDDEDSGNEEEEREAWKVRELRRIKRDREEREAEEKDEAERERIRDMTEEEREEYFKANPKAVLNEQERGKYKFMQKYYHRGVFYLDEDAEVLKRDFAQPTLEDHFDKSVLPKVMQVKNFGRQGRTKYTHLKDQDTTQFDAGWAAKTAVNERYESKRAGVKNDFDNPNKRVRKT